ncbi:multiple epidermal growth factor-like domains protein 10 [Physella acuta]|uniref:multiple epidermal growth factor-like domains protein 10 n=1 Tax=Physella acuta TaxID=109671 RepID=UPI0027DCF0E9|nr:multiple epidermal growth factor-like domains protein 10 [Physella acuta]
MGVSFLSILTCPSQHKSKDFPGKYTIRIKKIDSTEDFTLLGQWPDGTLEDKYLVVKFPSQPGKYLLQAIYAPHGRIFFSCADVTLDDTVQAEALDPSAEYPSKVENGAAGTHYSACRETFYGVDCKASCSMNCVNQSCDNVDGKCKECLPGKTGDFCEKDCKPGLYGPKCASKCESTCKGETNDCRPENGTCLLGCDDGYRGEMCRDECLSNTFGENCSQNCSATCLNQYADTCHHVTGNCLHGCQNGFSGTQCLEDFKIDITATCQPITSIVITSITSVLTFVFGVVVGILIKRYFHQCTSKQRKVKIEFDARTADVEITNVYNQAESDYHIYERPTV